METATILFVLGVLAIAAFTLLRHRHAVTASALTAPDRLRRAAAQLRAELKGKHGGGTHPKASARHEELAAVLQELSLRSMDPEASDGAILCYRRAAEAFRANARRLKGDEIEIHLGLLLYDFGLRTVESSRLRESIRILEKALAPRQGKWPHRLPRDFYEAAQAAALARLGARRGDEALLWEALTLCAASRESVADGPFKPPHFAVDVVAGEALTALGQAMADRAVLNDAVAANRRAIAAKKKIGVPRMLAGSQDELARALTALAQLDGKPEIVAQAVELFEEALANLDAAERPFSWGEVQVNMGRALTTLGRLEANPAILARALTAFQAALGLFTTEATPFQRADALDALGEGLLALASLRGDPDIAGLAADSHRKAEAILEVGDLAGTLARIRTYREAAQALYAQ